MHPDITLRSLQAVLTLDRERHFGRAARALGISQPSLSQLVKRVESGLGIVLFERRPVRPSPAGRQFIDRAASSMDSLEEGLALAQATATGSRGTLRIGFTPSAALSTMPGMVARFRRTNPGIDILLTEASTTDQVELVAAGELEAGFVRQFQSHPGIVRFRTLREAVQVVVPAGHPLAKERTLPLEALATEPFVHFPRAEAPSLYDNLREMCARAGFAPRVVQRASQWITIIALVEAGIGVSLVPESLAVLRWPGVRFLPITPTGMAAEVFAIFPRQGLSPVGIRFRDAVRGELSRVRRSRKGGTR